MSFLRKQAQRDRKCQFQDFAGLQDVSDPCLPSLLPHQKASQLHADEAKGRRDTKKVADMARRHEEGLLNPSQEMARSGTCTFMCTYLNLHLHAPAQGRTNDQRRIGQIGLKVG